MIPIARPRLVAHQNEIYYLFRDEERDSKVSLAYTDNLKKDKWEVTDLTDFPVNAWEPSYDTELCKNHKQLHIFVKNTFQGDVEKSVESLPTLIYVL